VGRARAEVVEVASRALLAGARLPRQAHGDVGPSDPTNHLEGGLHGGALAEQTVGAKLRLEGGVLGLEPAARFMIAAQEVLPIPRPLDGQPAVHGQGLEDGELSRAEGFDGPIPIDVQHPERRVAVGQGNAQQAAQPPREHALGQLVRAVRRLRVSQHDRPACLERLARQRAREGGVGWEVQPASVPGDPRLEAAFGVEQQQAASIAARDQDRPVNEDPQQIVELVHLVQVVECAQQKREVAPVSVRVAGEDRILRRGARVEELGPAARTLLETPGVSTMALGRLDEPAVGSIVRDMLAMPVEPRRFCRFLTRQSEGNPFFVAEYLHAAVAEGLLVRDARGRWDVRVGGGGRTETGYEELPLPRSLRALVGRRLDGLSGATQHVVEVASVFGRTVPEALLARAAGLDAEAAMAAVSQALAQHVLEEQEGDTVRFAHDKLRAIAYERLAPPRRVALHREVAEALAEAGRSDAEEPALLGALGHHWEQAGEAERARGCYLGAARAMVTRHATAEAERLYRAYLRLMGEVSAQGIGVRNELGRRILSIQGRPEEARAEHRAALEEAERLGDRHAQGESLAGLAHTFWKTGDFDRARELCAQALTAFRAVGDRAAEADALWLSAVLDLEQGRFEAAGALHEALALNKELARPRGQAMTLNSLGNLHLLQGRLDEARAHYRRAQRLFARVGDTRWEGHVIANVGLAYSYQGRMEEARPFYEQALAIGREVGDRPMEGVLLSNLALALAQEGQLRKARELFEQALEIDREVGGRRAEAHTLVNLAVLLHSQGDRREAVEQCEAALGRQRQQGDRNAEAITMGVLAACLRGEGRLREARELGERALAVHRESCNIQHEGEVLTDLGETARLEGRLEEARSLWERALERHREVGDRRYEAMTLRALARLEREAGGDLAAAQRLIDDAEAALGAGQDPARRAMCLCEHGHLALAQGRSARDLLARAKGQLRGTDLGPRTEAGRAVKRLQRAVAAAETGVALHAGECPDDLPEAVRRATSTSRSGA
jgi:tetratricopeptide (TPR) repeat protein